MRVEQRGNSMTNENMQPSQPRRLHISIFIRLTMLQNAYSGDGDIRFT